MEVALAYLIVATAVAAAHSLSDEDGESSILLGLVFPAVAAWLAAWLAVEAWDAVRRMAGALY